MADFTLDRLRTIMRTCGVNDEIDFESDISDIEVVTLGYDSLAMLQIASVIENEYGVALDDNTFVKINTPRTIVDYVNQQTEA
jgi:act minimal PKS acyl carrier protein